MGWKVTHQQLLSIFFVLKWCISHASKNKFWSRRCDPRLARNNINWYIFPRSFFLAGGNSAFIRLVLMWAKEHKNCSKTRSFLNGILEGHENAFRLSSICLIFNIFLESLTGPCIVSQSWILFKVCVLSIYWEFRDGLNLEEDICLRERTDSSLQESNPRTADLGKLHLMLAIHL